MLVKHTKANNALLHNLDQLIKEGVTRIGLKPTQFQLLHNTLSPELQAYYENEIPYNGAIIYKLVRKT